MQEPSGLTSEGLTAEQRQQLIDCICGQVRSALSGADWFRANLRAEIVLPADFQKRYAMACDTGIRVITIVAQQNPSTKEDPRRSVWPVPDRLAYEGGVANES